MPGEREVLLKFFQIWDSNGVNLLDTWYASLMIALKSALSSMSCNSFLRNGNCIKSPSLAFPIIAFTFS